jgi:hypothetical protein
MPKHTNRIRLTFRVCRTNYGRLRFHSDLAASVIKYDLALARRLCGERLWSKSWRKSHSYSLNLHLWSYETETEKVVTHENALAD